MNIETTVKYLGWMMKIPFFPDALDKLLIAKTAVLSPKNHEAINCVKNLVSDFENINLNQHHHGGLQFNLFDRPIGHIHGNGQVDLLFTRAIKNKLIDQEMVEDHPVMKNTGWVTFFLENHKQINHVIGLFELSYNLINEKYFVKKLKSYKDDDYKIAV